MKHSARMFMGVAMSVVLIAMPKIAVAASANVASVWFGVPFIRYSWIIPQTGDVAIAVGGIALAGAIALLGSLSVRAHARHKDKRQDTN